MEKIWILSFVLASVLTIVHGTILVAMLCILGRIHFKTMPAARALVTEDGPEIHTAMPPVEGTNVDGRPVRTTDFEDTDYVLLFISSDCEPCGPVLRAIHATQRDLARPVEFLAVLEAPLDEARRIIRRYRLRFPVIVDEHEQIRKRLGIRRTPYGLLVDSEGIVRMKGVVNNRGHLEGLIHRKGRNFAGLSWDPVQILEPQAPGR